MNKFILKIAELVINMLKKRNLEASARLHEETHAQYRLYKNLGVINSETARLKDKIELAQIVLAGVKETAEEVVPKAVDVLKEKSNIVRTVLKETSRLPFKLDVNLSDSLKKDVEAIKKWDSQK